MEDYKPDLRKDVMDNLTLLLMKYGIPATASSTPRKSI